MSASPASQPRRATPPRRTRVCNPFADRFLRRLLRTLSAGQSSGWRQELLGYVLALFISGVAALVTLFLARCFPAFNLEGVLLMAGIVAVALTWGVGPSLLAALVSATLLEVVVLPPHFSWQLQDPSKGMEILVLLLGSGGISLLANQSTRARRRAEALARSLKESQTSSDLERLRLRALVDALPVPVALLDAQERMLEFNPALQTFLGLPHPPRELAECQQAQAWWPATRQPVTPRSWPIARAALTGERVTNEEIELETADGQRKMVLDSAIPIRDERGVIQGAVGVFQDMTEHKRLEEALRQSQQDTEARARELEAIFEALTDGLLVYDAQGGILRCNTAARGIFGFEAHPEFASLPWQERASRYGSRDAEGQLVPSEDLVLSRLLRGEVFTSKEANDQRLQTPDGREVTVSITGRCLRHARGPISGAVAIVRDVTERRRLEQEVVERAAQLAAIFESVADGLVVTDAQGRMLQVNQALRTLLGIELDPTGRTRLQLEELAGYAAYTTEGQPLREGEDPISTALEGQVLTKEQSVDLLFRTRDGCEVWANGTSAPIRDQRGQIIGCVGVIRDVTAQRRQEQQTHETLTALLAMAEALVETPDQASDACLRLTPRADQVARRLAELTRSVLGCQYVSMAAVEPATQTLTPLTVVGLSPEEEQQWWASWRSPLHFGDGLPPGAVAALWRGEPILLDTPQALLPIWQRVRPEHKAVLVPMRAGETLVGMLRVDNRAQGEDYIGPNKQALIRAVTRLGALVLERERLLHERTEARANELALRETQAQMETFLGIAGHELKSPLTSIKLALQLMERRLHRLTQDEIAATHALAPSVEEVARARLQAARLERLVNELIDVSRVRAGKLELHQEPTDLAAIVREAVDEQRQANPARTFAFQLPSDRAVPVWGDADRLGQVVTNYLTNALKYSPANRPVAVGLDLDDRQARVWVRDQGPGLPPQEHERIWDRFHRVKGIQVQSGTGVGLGLGLHICRTIVEWHQGQVGVESMPGQGSTFWFTLPLGSQG